MVVCQLSRPRGLSDQGEEQAKTKIAVLAVGSSRNDVHSNMPEPAEYAGLRLNDSVWRVRDWECVQG